MTRREVLAAAVTSPAWLSMSEAHAAHTPTSHPLTPAAAPDSAQPTRTSSSPLRHMGGAPTAFSLRSRSHRQTWDALEHCHQLGLGAVQTRLPNTEPATVKQFRQRLDAYDMRAILSAPLPHAPEDVAAFDTAVAACKEAGAHIMHAAMTQRRYEEFESVQAFKTHFEGCQKAVALAEPVLRKHRMKLAIENHKGWRAAEHADWMQRVGSEWVGVCFDFGNNVALCEDPMDTLRALAPYTIYCHMKDMGVQPNDEGFALSEVVFGQGFVDLGSIVETLQQRDPQIIFALEMITRDPLNIPVFADRYWPTFDDASSGLPGRDLAKVLTIVKKQASKQPLPRISGLSPEAQVALEDDLNQRCLDYCRQHMPMLS